MSTQQFIEQHPAITFGCDPEGFFQRDGGVIGAEKVIPDKNGYPSLNSIVLDGVQFEFNPSPSHCRALLANDISRSFKTLKKHLSEMKGVTASFNRAVVEISKEGLDSLSEKAKVFGCMPSKNAYDVSATITANPATYLKRSAGGHLHFGLSKPVMEERERLVKLFDVLIGNTCVLIDRDPGAAERRKNYGRAGEYRLPKHGIEYRTLSNFWLQSYPLMSFVMGLGRLAIGVLHTTLYSRKEYYGCSAIIPWDAEGDLLKRVKIEDICKAINENDLTLAKKNFKGVKEFIKEHVKATTSSYGEIHGSGLDESKLELFDFFCRKVQKFGLNYWFPKDPMDHWATLGEGHGIGWESFLTVDVKKKMELVKKKKVIV
jgi:hypothetical protein